VNMSQGVGDKLRIVALSHAQQQPALHRAASYHSGGDVSVDHVPVIMPPHSLSWNASRAAGGGEIHEC
jgi:hypothetical protein